jgi:hypothetical protein
MLLSSIGMIQCATKSQVVQETEEGILKKRVREYWDHRIKGEWDKSYLYELPEYREKVSVLKYINQNGRSLVKWVSYEIMEVAISGEEGKIRLNGKYRYLAPQTKNAEFQRMIEEQWVKVETQWYRFAQQ